MTKPLDDRSPAGDPAPQPRPARIAPRVERRAEARAEQASRLLAAARAMKPLVTVTLPEIQAAIRARRFTAMYSVGRLAAVSAVVLCPVLALASVAVSRAWWPRREPATTPTSISVPSGATARVSRHGRFDLSLTGPTEVEIAGNDQAIRLEAGQLMLANPARNQAQDQARVVEVLTPGHRVEIAPSATVSVGVAAGQGVQVTSMAGPAPRVDGVSVTEPARASGAGPRTASTPPATLGVPAATLGAPGAPPDGARPAARARPTRSSPAADEVGVVHDALEQLRGEKNGAAALRLLDEYDRRFPDGLLRDEADLIRIEALLALRRTVEALDRLEAMPPALLDRSPRLRVARGELRASHGRCREALVDFEAAAAAGAGSEIERRIQRGRDACNSGDPRHTRDRGDNR